MKHTLILLIALLLVPLVATMHFQPLKLTTK
jgi:hypothetical protein